MSFSSDIKEKLTLTGEMCKDCDRFFLAGFMSTAARISPESITFSTESEPTVTLFCELIKRMYNTKITLVDKKTKYVMEINDKSVISNMLTDTGYLSDFPEQGNECCPGAFVRGAFLGGGSITDPKKSYHLEFDFKIPAEAKKLEDLLLGIGIDVKHTERRSYTVIYVKGYEAIADVLGLMGAGGAAVGIYHIFAEKDLINRINRQMNCEGANMDKITVACGRHTQAIKKLQKSAAYSKLPDHLKETAELRIRYPEDSLADLGKKFKKPIGKSGVNHRLNKLIELAENLK